MPHRVRIALNIGRAGYSPRHFRQGIRRIAEENPDWLLREWSTTMDPTGEMLRAWKPDGLIGRIETPLLAEIVRETGVRAVFLTGHRESTIPGARLCLEEEAIGRLAATHFLERGFTTFACVTVAGQTWPARRHEGFLAALHDAGTSCMQYELPESRQVLMSNIAWLRLDEGLAAWLTSLPTPIGIFAIHDVFGREVLDTCLREGIAVPESIAVLGAGDNLDICETTHPRLSSVHVPWAWMGSRAARLLQGLLAGEQFEDCVPIPIESITERQSSSVVAINEEDLAAALRYIREHACDPVDVDTVARETAIGRRRLERGLRRLLGRTPHEEIRRIQLDRAKRLLTRTGLSIPEIAAQAGISRAHFSKVFHETVGLPPSEYRNQNHVE